MKMSRAALEALHTEYSNKLKPILEKRVNAGSEALSEDDIANEAKFSEALADVNVRLADLDKLDAMNSTKTEEFANVKTGKNSEIKSSTKEIFGGEGSSSSRVNMKSYKKATFADAITVKFAQNLLDSENKKITNVFKTALKNGIKNKFGVDLDASLEVQREQFTGVAMDLDSTGGVMVSTQTIFDDYLFNKSGQAFLNKVRRMDLDSTDPLNMPTQEELFGGVVLQSTGEVNEAKEQDMKFNGLNYNPKEGIILLPISNKILNSSNGSAILTFLTSLVEKAVLDGLDRWIVKGNGKDQPTGITNAGDAVIVMPRAAATPTYDEVQKFILAHKQGDGSVIFAGTGGLLSLKTIKDNQGRPYFIEVNGNGGNIMDNGQLRDADLVGYIDGLPVYRSFKLSKNAGDKFDIILADMQSYILAMFGDMEQAISTEANFKKNGLVMRIVVNVDGSTWNKKPLKADIDSDEEISPFVTFAQHS